MTIYTGRFFYHRTLLNRINLLTTRPKFDFYVSKYFDKYSALEYEIKTL